MKKLTTFAFYYTIFALTLLVIASFFYLEAPYNLIQAIILAPSLIFLWLKLTDPVGATESQWSGRFVIVIVVFVCLGLFGYYLNSLSEDNIKKQKSDILNNINIENTATLSAQLVALRTELESIKNKENNNSATSSGKTDTEIIDLTNSLGTPQPSPAPTAIPQIKLGTVKAKTSSGADIYELGNLNSKIIGVAIGGVKYDYFKVFDGWYLIEFEEDLSGWVQLSQMQKLN